MTLAQLPSTTVAMKTLAQTHPLLTVPLAHMPAIEDADKTASIATDGQTITVNPDFMAAHDDEGRVYMLGFIALMLIHDFIGRVGDRDRGVWSMACNTSIHNPLAKEGLPGRPPESIVLDEGMTEDMTAEEIYDRLMSGTVMICGKSLQEMLKGIEVEAAMPDDLPPLGEIVDETGASVIDSMGGYTHAQLDAAFDQVKDPQHWKNPIDAIVDADMKPVLNRAIPYFTGMPADFDDEGVPPGKVRVLCEGYFAGPCN